LIACASFRTGNSEIFTFNPNGTELNPVNLTNNPASDGRPRWSPDGRQIVFESNRSGAFELYIMNADGSNVRRLTFGGVPGVHGNSSGSWHPDGSQIAYQSTRTGHFQIFKIFVDGTGDQRLTSSATEESLPAWSPLGTKIAFSSRLQDVNADVHIMNPDGSGVVNLTNNPGVEDSWPTWSPDGAQIAFHSRRDDPGGEEIYRMPSTGGPVTKLTNNGPNLFDIFPAWSPDGTRILWNSRRQGATNFGEVFHMNAVDGSDVRRVTNHPDVDQRCDWQPLCTIYGAGDIMGTPGNDIICGSHGPDRIYGAGGNDRILGLGGDDWVFGGPGNDTLFGGLGNDRVYGEAGADFLSAGPGNDFIVADAGETVDVGAGTDQCSIGGVPGCPPRIS
jgi:Tol biopolymer transport system component